MEEPQEYQEDVETMTARETYERIQKQNQEDICAAIEQLAKQAGIPDCYVVAINGHYDTIAVDSKEHIYPIGTYTSKSQAESRIAHDALKGIINYPNIVPEDRRLSSLQAVMKMKELHSGKWRDKWHYNDKYWLCRLMEEVGEAASVIAGKHEDSLEIELIQIASIVLNWLQLLEDRPTLYQQTVSDEDFDEEYD